MAWTLTSNNYDGRTIKLTVSETVNKGSNSSTLNWTLTSAGGNSTYYSIAATSVKLKYRHWNSTSKKYEDEYEDIVYSKGATNWNAKVFPAATGSISGSVTAYHNDDGNGSVYIELNTRVYYSSAEKHSATKSLTKIDYYTLSTTASHSTITVKRTSSGYAYPINNSIGSATYGKNKLYKDDVLQISATASSGYILSSLKVNDAKFTSGKKHTVSKNVTITASAEPIYTLTISKSSYGTAVVYRTSSAYGSTGNLSNGASIYKGDKLKITFGVSSSTYQIDKHTVNGTTFTSGNTYTVSGNTTVLVTGKQLLTIAKSSGNITSATSSVTITVTRYNTSYKYRIKASLNGNSQWIKITNGVGSLVSNSDKYTDASFSLPVAETFYTWMMSSTSQTCTLTCYTYDGDTLVGSTTSSFTVSTKESECRPVVSGSVIDTNQLTVSLTDNNQKLVLGLSDAEVHIDETFQYGATETLLKVNGEAAPFTPITYIKNDASSFNIELTDSRGYKNTPYIISPQGGVVKYQALSFKYRIYRENPTDDKFRLTFSGNMFIGSFGRYENEIRIRYQYKEIGSGDYNPLQTINSSNILFGATTYRSTNNDTPESNVIILPDTFDYRKSYQFQIYVEDGNFSQANPEISVTTLRYEAVVQRGVPVFDWGENDFQVNVDMGVGGNFNAPNHQNHILWSYIDAGLSDGLQMGANDTITLSERASEQFSGICLVLKAANGTTTTQTNRVTFFIPKDSVDTSHRGYAISMAYPSGSSPYATILGNKYIYVQDETDSQNITHTVLSGHAGNEKTSTTVVSNVLTIDNSHWVLAYVYGV